MFEPEISNVIFNLSGSSELHISYDYVPEEYALNLTSNFNYETAFQYDFECNLNLTSNFNYETAFQYEFECNLNLKSDFSYYVLLTYEPEETNLFRIIFNLRPQWLFPPSPSEPEIKDPVVSPIILNSNVDVNLKLFYDSLESLLSSDRFINDFIYNFAIDKYRNTGKEYYYFVNSTSKEELLFFYSLVIGTDIYADWSSIVGASIHSGVVKLNQKKIIAIKSLPPQSTYYGSLSNGILSTGTTAPVLGSFSVRSLFLNIEGTAEQELILNELPSYEYPEPESDNGIVKLELNSLFDSYILYVYDPFKVQIQNVPSNFLGLNLINFYKKFLIKIKGSASGLVFGSNPYTIDSSIATAAVHSGAVAANKTAYCSVLILPKQNSYPGSVKNGIPSFSSTAEQDELFGYNFSYSIYKNYISITGKIDINQSFEPYTTQGSINLSGSALFQVNDQTFEFYQAQGSAVISGSALFEIDTTPPPVATEVLILKLNSNIDYKFLINPYEFSLDLSLYNNNSIATWIQQVENVVLGLISNFSTLFKLNYKFSSLNKTLFNDLVFGIDRDGLLTFIYGPSGYLPRLSGRANIVSVTNVVLKLSSEINSLPIFQESSIASLKIVSQKTEYNRNRFMYDFNGKLKLGMEKRRGFDFGIQHGFTLDSNWVLGGTGLPDIVLDFNSEWSNLSDLYYWYRVLACYDYGEESLNSTSTYYKSLKVQSNSSSYSKCNRVLDTVYDVSCGNDKPSLITGVVARNINEVCRILKRPSLGPNLYFKILSIKKHKDPIGFGNGISSDLEDVEFCNSPECLDFCIDYDLTNKSSDPCYYITFNMSVFSDVLGSLFYHPKEEINKPIKISGSHPLFLIKMGNATVQSSVLKLKIGSSCDDTLYTEDGIAILSELGNKVLLEYSVCKNEIELDNILIPFEAKLKLKSSSLFSSSDYNYVPKSGIKVLSRFELYLYSNYFYLFKFYESDSKFKVLSRTKYNVELEYDCDDHRYFIDVGGKCEHSFSRNFNLNSVVNLTCTPSHKHYGIYLNVGSTINYESENYTIKLEDLKTRVISPYWSYDSLLEINFFKDTSYIERCFNFNVPLKISSNIGSVNYGYSINSFLRIGVSSEIQEIYLDSIGLIRYAYPTADSKLKISNTSELYYLDSSDSYKFIESFDLKDSFVIGNKVTDVSLENSINQLPYDEITVNSFNINTCGCVSLSSVLSLSHTLLIEESPLTNFLINNNISFPSLLNLKYNKYNNSWISNTNLRSNSENWQLIFELNCISNQEELNNYLRFSFKASRNYANYRLKTLLSVVIDPRLVCELGDLSTIISFNENKKVYVDDNPADYYSYKDDIGLFIFSNYKINCDDARKNKVGFGRRDGFVYCGGNGTFDFKINYPVAPIIEDKIRIDPPQQVIL